MTTKRILVTGGGGFLGSRICALLVARGYQVRSFSRGNYPHLQQLGVECIQGNLHNSQEVLAAARGMDAIIHSGAKAGIWGQPQEFFRSNVLGTTHVIAAAKTLGIRRLVYTSSPSIVFDKQSITGADERLPIPAKHCAQYPATKAEGERLVLAANSASLHTVALRPHFIWGPGDKYILPMLKEKAGKKQLFIVGDGKALIDVIYVDNAAGAHIQALEALAPAASLCGKSYFIGQEKPVVTWDFIRRLLATQGIVLSCPRRIPYGLAYQLGFACELLYGFLRIYHRDPPLTRFLAFSLAKSHYFDHSAALRDFAYKPQINLEEGFARLQQSL